MITVVLPIDELIEELRTNLEPFLGRQIGVVDYQEVMRRLIEEICYKTYHNGGALAYIRSFIPSPSDMGVSVYHHMRTKLSAMLSCNSELWGDDFQQQLSLVTDTGAYFQMERIQSENIPDESTVALLEKYTQEPLDEDDVYLLEDLIEQIRQEIKDGAWYPEKVRRFVGA